MKIKWMTFIILCLAVSGTMTACKQTNLQPDGAKEVTVIEVYEEKDVNESLFSGTLQAIDETLVSFQVSGQIKGIYVDEGDQVVPGDNLAELDNESYSLQADITNLNLEKAMVAYEKSLTDFNRYSKLYEAGAISSSEMETISAQRIASEKDLQSAQAGCELANFSLAKTHLESPVSGAVISKMVSVGQTINAGTSVFKIGNIERLKVVLQVPDYEISKWREGGKIPVTLYGTTKEGTVSKILPSVSQGTGTIGVEITIDNSQKDWISGQVVTCMQETKGTEAIFLPIGAVINEGTTESYVFITDGDTVVKTSITPGKLKDDKLEICSGLKPGDKVVTKGANSLFDKDKIQIVKEVEY